MPCYSRACTVVSAIVFGSRLVDQLDKVEYCDTSEKKFLADRQRKAYPTYESHCSSRPKDGVRGF